MSKIETILRELYMSGKISVGESAAIFGAVELIGELIATDNEHTRKIANVFAGNYGTFAVDALHELIKDNE